MSVPRPRRILLGAAIVGLLIAGLWLASSSLREPDPAGVPEGAVAYTVERVVDGDTLVVRDGDDDVRVRLIGIDTPEARPEAECGADAATSRLRELAPDGGRIWMIGDREPVDRYDRALRYLWTPDGMFVNEALVAEGHAETLRIPPNTRYAAALADAERTAKAQALGRWGSC
ncbi:thermonuclease family protein [Microbacterium sp. NPDC077663]|uniref:thermonuclease family protein n=1 Tax=Microbacterium sp. NPDC077663 TaxID=3364189 RepID=UPI0037C868A6